MINRRMGQFGLILEGRDNSNGVLGEKNITSHHRRDQPKDSENTRYLANSW